MAVNWRLRPKNESMLRSLLENGMDNVACECSHFYRNDADLDLFYLAMKHSNEIFLRFAFSK